MNASHSDSYHQDKVRIFCLSMQRTGTTSVGKFFRDFGFRWAGWPADKQNNWSGSWYEGDFERIFSSPAFRSANAFEDSPWFLPDFYKVLFFRFPNSKFILLTRDPDAWFQSMLNHSQGNIMGRTRIHCKIYRRELEYFDQLHSTAIEEAESQPYPAKPMTLIGHAEHYKDVYRLHNTEVQDFFQRQSLHSLYVGVAETGAKVDIDDDGTIKIASSDPAKIEAARNWIRGIVAEPEPGTIYTGKVASLVDFGAFVTFMPGKDGLVHVSEIKNERVENVRDVLSEGQEVKVKLLEVDQRGKVRLSMRLVDQETGEELPDTRPPREPREGGDRGPRGDRGDRGPRGDRHRGGRDDRGPRRDRGPRDDRGPRGEGRGDRSPRREREGSENEGNAPEFAPAFLTGGNDED
jgi:predicted RNA-binding protein with RPS1 domain